MQNPAGRLLRSVNVLESAIQENVLKANVTREKESRKAVKPARRISKRKRVAARMESNAVTGPCTAEYGPCNVGKRKIPRTDRTAINANPQASRPGVIGKFNYTCGTAQRSPGRWLLPG